MADTMAWIDPAGDVHPLDLPDSFVEGRGPIGRMSPPVDYSDEVVPLQAGSRLRQVRYEAREVSVPIVLTGDVETATRLWAARFDPTRGDGKLRAGSRELVCRYVDGLHQADEQFQDVRRWVVVFRAFDPFWQDATDTTETFTTGSDLPNFFPFPPFRLVSSTATGTPLVANDGDVEAWPVWEVLGPGGPVELRNDTTGETLELSTVLAAGQTLHIDTRPGAKTIVDGDGANRYPDRQAGSALWPLERGDNQLTVVLPGADGTSRVQLAYRRRFLSA